jgi:hypothetical protein
MLSTARPAITKELSIGGLPESRSQRQPMDRTVTQLRRVVVGAVPSPEIEEYFEAIVEEISDDVVRLRTVSSTGEEASALLAISSIPPGERAYLEPGAPMRITVLIRSRPTAKPGRFTQVRETDVRVLRPSQRYRPSTELREHVAGIILDRMMATLSSKG